MATTISNPQVGTFKRIKAHYIAAAAVASLAVTGLVGGAMLLNDTASTSSAPISISQPSAPFYPEVQEQSHPVVPAASSVDAPALSAPFYPEVQEQSHPVVSAPSSIEVASELTPFYPQVQEQSHPVIPAAAASDSTVDNGSYPLVQEMSHPR